MSIKGEVVNHRIRRVLMASVVTASTLVAGVVTAPLASADVGYIGWAYPATGPYKGLAYAQTWMECGNPVTGGYESVIAVSIDDAFDVSTPPWDIMGGYRHQAGTTATLRLEQVGGTQGSGCTATDWRATKVTVSVVELTEDSSATVGTQIGDTEWVYFPSADNFLQTHQIEFDDDPLDGTVGTPLEGNFELLIEVEVAGATPDITYDSRGNYSGTLLRTNQAGYLISAPEYQYLLGWHQKSKADLDAVEGVLGGSNQFGLVRHFKSSWGNPGTTGTVNDYADEGKAVAWSVKPPAWTGSCPQNLGQAGIEACSGTSAWDKAAADNTDGESLRSMIRQLQDHAGGAGEPSFHTITISHEPHDNAIDTVQGWNGGAGSRKCGTTSDPGLGIDLNSDGDYDDTNEMEPCAGTVADFKAMYTNLRTARDGACDGSGGTGGTGSPCSRVKIQYIGTVTRLIEKGGGTFVGDADLARPNSADYDILGADPYNYGCYDNSTCTGDGGWDSFEETIDDPAAAYDRVALPHYKMTLLGLAERLGKRVILDEVGSHPGCNGVSDFTFNCDGSSGVTSRSTWMADAYDYMTTDVEAQRYLIGWIYFHVSKSNEWRFFDYSGLDFDNRGSAAYTADFAADPDFLSTANGYTLNLTP
jgi:hypothetical protein